ncbi:MAG: hypothetical protein R3351_00435 [Nitrospirales bacterium]|nr:hypothetical protein [Nitrospirales bacterium]
MAKRKTIKNNPLDSLSSHSPQEPPAGFENLLIGSEKPSSGIAAKPSGKGNTTVAKDRNRKSQVVPTAKLVVKDDRPKEKAKKKPSEEVSPDKLAQRISRLEEDNRMQNIMIGIIMVPLAVLALLGAAPLP